MMIFAHAIGIVYTKAEGETIDLGPLNPADCTIRSTDTLQETAVL